MSFKENLHFLMDSKEITVKELAYLSGLSENTLKGYLKTDSAEPSFPKVIKIAKALNVSVDSLAFGIITTHNDFLHSQEINLYRKYAKLITALESFPQEKQKLLEESFQAVIKAAK